MLVQSRQLISSSTIASIRHPQPIRIQLCHKSTSPYGKSHLAPPPRLPRPLAPYFPQLVILSDGSSYTHHTTSPRSVFRLTRDVRNNPLWSPGSERKTDGDNETGRMARFKRRFGQGTDTDGM
ncbi:hypothetical protein BOTBODRAFT_138336 [Botryobasidium botryosum FD-172 SS1]|uniref:Ribosomal protein bL31m N-terminal domain-containing protein n=1 Tax=Botryobasidium botryosum (strain FD-172 SS1) TaxID=930990 RepID=A0A067M0C1_BOTB1|nr:hypothetical protein BOTBODRAFT_138336 [Botryobasidium botryosum FD-172 SS1]